MLVKRRSSAAIAGGAVALVLMGASLAVVLMLAGVAAIPNPFSTTTNERPHTAVLAELKTASRFTAATGRYTTVVDVEQRSDHLPSVLQGNRSILIAEGDVDASVDFAGLSDKGLEVKDEDSVVVHLPEPEVGEVRLDHDHTYVAARERGILDRAADAVGDAPNAEDQGLYQRADDQLHAAAERSELRDRAKEHTTEFVKKTVGALGYTDVTVVYDAPNPAEAA